MLTGLLYAAVIAMWAVVLLPRWLGTSDRYRDARTTQRFRRSLRSVSVRRHRSHDMATMPDGSATRVDTSPKDSAIDAHLDFGIDPFVGTAEDGRRRQLRDQQVREQVTTAATRRRRIFLGLSGATAVAFVGTILGVVSVAWLLLLGAALGGYVYLLRSQALIRRSSVNPAASATGDGAGDVAGATGTWEPVQSPEPSYMRAPKATAVPRELDSDANGPWTAERMLEQAAALRSGDDAESDLGLDEYAYPGQYNGPRAVNE